MATTPEATKSSPVEAPGQQAPVVVDLGKKSRKRVRELRRGEGPLLAKVNGVIDELKQAGTIASNAQAVIVVVRQKPCGKSLLFPML